MRAIGESHGRRSARNLLHRDHMRQVPEVRPPEVLFHRDAEQPKVPQLAPELGRKCIVPVNLCCEGRDFFLCKSLYAVAEKIHRLSQRKVKLRHTCSRHAARFVRVHASRPRRRYKQDGSFVHSSGRTGTRNRLFGFRGIEVPLQRRRSWSPLRVG